VDIGQIIVGNVLILVLVGLALCYGWHQWQYLRGPVEDTEEGEFYRKQAKRRLVNSFLLLILAGLLAGAMIWLEAPAQALADSPEQRTPEQTEFARKYGWYWIVLMLVLLAVVIVAGIDYVATRRFRIKQLHQLEEEKRELMRDMAARVRRERLESN